ncbi:MAG: hypothetical protein M1814_006414 [Vezdaea aestivalis]|nr:MAG: hypothetical protein M1814_006414 [Vezdaea aestivalis]
MSTLVEISTAIIQPVGKPSPQVLRIIKTRNQTGRRHKVPAGSVDDDAFASTLPPKRDIGKEVAMMPDVGRRRVDKALPPIPPPATAAVPISDPIFLNHQPLDASGKRFYSSQTDLQSKVLPEPRIPSPPPAYSPTAEFTHQSPNFSNLSPDILDRPSPVPSPSVWSDLSTQTKQSAPAFEVQTPSTSPEVELPSPPILKHSQLSLKRSAAIRVNDRRTGLRRPLDSQDKKLVEQLPQPLLPNKNKALPLDPAIETVEALLNSKAQSAVVPCENQFTNEVMGGNQSSIDSKADANGLRQIFATKKRRTRHSSKEIVDDWNDSALSVTAAPPQPPIDRYKENVPPPMASSLALNGSPLPKGLEPQTPLRRRQASSSRSLSGSQSSLTPRKPPPPRIDTSFVLPPPIRKHSHTDSNTSATATIIAQYTEPTPPVTPLDGRPQGERVVLTRVKRKQRLTQITTPLFPDRVIDKCRGVLTNDIIGKHPGAAAYALPDGRNKPPAKWTIARPSFKDYIELTPRLVTPIYPGIAQIITSHLDIHPLPRSSSRTSPLEILEAGTGHGSVALHISRILQSFNTAPPLEPPLLLPPPTSKVTYLKASITSLMVKRGERHISTLSTTDQAAYREWRAGRNAILHSVEASSLHASFAERIVHGFRSGLYSGNIDFYHADVVKWVQERLAGNNGEPFLAHAVLDLPGAKEALTEVSKAIVVGGTVLVFVPNVTQLVECLGLVQEDREGLWLEETLQMDGAGGRQWEVKMAKLRTLRSTKERNNLPISEGIPEEYEGEDNNDGEEDELAYGSADEKAVSGGARPEHAVVCRPSLGMRYTAGGFLGIFRKRPAANRSWSTVKEEYDDFVGSHPAPKGES